jgi:hypothetical protein
MVKLSSGEATCVRWLYHAAHFAIRQTPFIRDFAMTDYAHLDFEGRLGEVFVRAAPKLPGEAGAQLAALVEPRSLAIIAGVAAAWIAGHAFGVGEVVDVIIGVVGLASVGLAVFSGLDELYQFSAGAYRARSARELDTAADHLAEAVAILGVTAVLAVLFRGRPRSGTARVNIGPEPARGPGWRYKPTTEMDAPLPYGVKGRTTPWGDIKISNMTTPLERDIALVHEKVHRFLGAKFYPLRVVRVENRFRSYFHTSIYRYFEEALAQTIALVGRVGFHRAFEGIGFPVRNGYVYLTKGGGYGPLMKGRGLAPETAGLIGAGMVEGYAYALWFAPGERP